MPEDEGQSSQTKGGSIGRDKEREKRRGSGRGRRGAGQRGAVVGNSSPGGEGRRRAQQAPLQQLPPQQRLRQRRLQTTALQHQQQQHRQQQEERQQREEKEEERRRQQQQQIEKQKTTDALLRVRLRRSEHARLAAGAGGKAISRARHKMLNQRAATGPTPTLLEDRLPVSHTATMTTAPTPPPQATQEGQRTDVADDVPEGPETTELGSRFSCFICDGVLPTLMARDNHVRELGMGHTSPSDDVDGYCCRTCQRVFCSASELDRHVLSHPDEEVIKCPFCPQPLRTNRELHQHLRAHAQQMGVQRPKRPHTALPSEDVDDEQVEAKRWSPSSLDGEDEVVALAGSVPAPAPAPGPRFTCPVCPPSDPFRAPYLPELEAHLEQNHRDYSAPCDVCDSSFKSVRDLNLHRYSAHRGKTRHRDVVGFKDLTFVDFSSQKFPQIAVAECEKSLHRAANRQHPFQCECGRAFPCDEALAIHRQGCPHTVYVDAPADLSRSSNNNNSNHINSEHRTGCDTHSQSDVAPACDHKGDFFAKLDLRNSKSTPSSPVLSGGASPAAPERERDLADIQSILTVSSGPGSILLQDNVEEEQQDAFAAEFRRMKQRGEFPCRLCPEVFPNLRALKGHNRAHMSTPGADGYRCNMCPHAALDKMALQRHMRTHNGARPYECRLCHYAFTTKANCERHLRNRHSKNLREEVKLSIIYHPSEDPGNDPDAKIDAKRSLFAEPSEQRVPSPNCPAPTSVSLLDVEPLRRPSLDVATMTSEDEADRQSPLDLSMVLDLRKKRPPTPLQPDDDDPCPEDEVEEDDLDDEQPQDLSRKSTSDVQTDAPASLEQRLQQDTVSFPALGPLYVPPFQLSVQTSVPQGVTPGMPFPTYYPQLPNLFRSLQLGGGLVLDPMNLLQRSPAAFLSSGEVATLPAGIPASSTPSLVSEPCGKDIEASSRSSMPASPKSERSSASDSHISQQQGHSKMVMKNGVLVPKQKQRRYRTERPFVCEHCEARFTLSSNRERHVKQQHPQYWSQRHRGPLVVRDNPSSPPPPPTSTSSVSQVVPSPAHPDVDRSKVREEEDEDEGLVIDEERPQNSDQVDEGTEGDAEDEGQPAVIAGVVGGVAAGEDLASVSRLLDNASTQTFRQFFRDGEEGPVGPPVPPHHEDAIGSEEEEEGLVAAGSPSDGNNSGSEEKSECESNMPKKKKSAYSLAPNRVSCPYCSRKFPWSSSLRRHILTHTGQKPYKCLHCPLLFTTKSNCDRHLARKHSNKDRKDANTSGSSVSPGTLSITPNSSTTSVSPGLSASSRSPPDIDVTLTTPLSPQNYQMRNVPDRPYKCRHCPSSKFATLSNLRKHVACKHTGSSVENCVSSFDDRGRVMGLSGYESHSSVSDELEHLEEKQSGNAVDKAEVKAPFYNMNSDSQPLSLCKTENTETEVSSNVKGEIKEEKPLSLCKVQESDSGNNNLTAPTAALPIVAPVVSIPEGSASRPADSPIVLSSSELPFKCHLCDGSFTERQECLDHIRLNHTTEYEILLSKGALELSVATSPEDNNNDDSHPTDGDNIDHLRGKFPDYANRKVMCAFCMHRFWSAEDLRRHMRTHTGERPFSCDVCFKRFTLKHSMLRHWRKHRDLTNNNTNNNNNNNNNNNSISAPLLNSSGAEDLSTSAASGDEEGFPGSLRNPSARADLIMDHDVNMANHNNNNINLAAVKMFRVWSENHLNVNHSLRRREEEDSGLISNLLGIGDPAIIDKVLITKSADDAEKILGVFKNNKRM